MADDVRTTIADMMSGAPGMWAVTPTIGSQCQDFWKAQESILQETEAFSRAWFARRHEATRTALDVARKVGENGGSQPAEAMRAITEWQRGSLARLTRDMQEWMDLTAHCTAHLAGSRTEAGTGTEGWEKASTEKGKAPQSRAKQTTPV